MGVMILGAICELLALLSFVISFRSFRQKGFVFNNAYIFASESERQSMNREPCYRQSAIAFLLTGFILAILGLGIILSCVWLACLSGGMAISLLIYVIISDRSLSKAKQ